MSEVAVNNSPNLATESESNLFQDDKKTDVKMDLFLLRQALADDLRNFEGEGRANEDKEAVLEAIKSLDSMKLDEMTADDIEDIKQQVEQLKEQVASDTEKKNGPKKMFSRLGFKKRAGKSPDHESKASHPSKKELHDAEEKEEEGEIKNLVPKDEAAGDDAGEEGGHGMEEAEQPAVEGSAETHLSQAKSMERGSSAASKRSIISRLSMKRSPSNASKKSVGEKSTTSKKSTKTADAEDSPNVELGRNASLSSKRSLGSAASKKSVLSAVSKASAGAGAPKTMEKRQSSLKQPKPFDRQPSQGSVTWVSSFEQPIQMKRSVSTMVNDNGEVEMENIEEKTSTHHQSE